MGTLSVLIRCRSRRGRLAGGGDLLAYQLGSIPCVAAGVLGLAIARWMERRGASRAACIATIVFSMVNPLTREALVLGHPEELLGARCAWAPCWPRCEAARPARACCWASRSPPSNGP